MTESQPLRVEHRDLDDVIARLLEGPYVDHLGGRKSYDGEAHARFTALIERWGDPAYLAERHRAMRAMRAGLDAPTDRGLIDDWRRRFDDLKPRSR